METTKSKTVVLLVADKPHGSGHVFSEDTLKRLAKDNTDKSVFGQVYADNSTGRVDLSKVSHTISNIRYDSVTKELVGEVSFLNTPHGDHAKLAWHHNLIDFSPVYSYDPQNENIGDTMKLLMVNAKSVQS